MKNCPECALELEVSFNTNNSSLEPRDDYYCTKCKIKYYTVGISPLKVLPRPRLHCQFCNDYCHYLNIGLCYEHWKCNECRVEFQLRASTPPRKVVNFYCQLNDKIYCVSVIEHEERVQIYTVSKSEEMDYEEHEIICEINQVPNITPKNVISKLRTYITFS